jgi:hypothetical protein
MSKFLLPLLAALFGLVLATGAEAQATRTWVSGVGDDANPCSRTAPCKTFAGAISKTAAGGEISVLDPGGFGTLNITKGITINGEGTLASTLASAVNGIIVNAGPNDVVVIRNLSINGAGTTLGLNGIRFLAGKALHVDRVQIQNFSQSGISFEPSGNASLHVNNSIISNINAGNAVDKAGLLVRPGAAGEAAVIMSNTLIEGGRIGILVRDRSKVMLDNTVVSRNAVMGAWVQTTSAAATLFAKNSTFAHNGPVPTFITSGTGVRSEGATSSIRLANTVITGSEFALRSVTSGAILSYGDNQISGNGTDGTPTGFVTEI